MISIPALDAPPIPPKKDIGTDITNAQGQDCLLIAEAQEDGLYLLREQPVELGLETDLDIAVKADSLTDGMVAVTNPEQHVSHVGQKIAIGSAARQGLLGGN